MKSSLTAIQIEGNLLAPDMTTQLLEGSVRGQTAEDFGLLKTDKLADEIANAWGDAKAYWAAFQRALERLDADDSAESQVQIKATSRILGAAAQISENHERLINEVVDMVEEDLNNEANMSQRQSYTVEILKQKYKTLRDAKAHFNLKANSWEALVNQLNTVFLQSSVAEDKPQLNQSLNGKQGNDYTKVEKVAVFLEPDVSQMFPTSEAVNEALRFLIRVATIKK